MELQEKIFTIQQLSLKLNIPKSTLRFWESELSGVIAPLRTSGGQRRYTSEHIAIIEKIQKLKGQGMRLMDIKREIQVDEIRENPNSKKIDLLVNRIAKAVKAEIASFIETESSNSKVFNIDEG